MLLHCVFLVIADSSASLILISDCEKMQVSPFPETFVGLEMPECVVGRLPAICFRSKSVCQRSFSKPWRVFVGTLLLVPPHDLFPGAEGAPKELFEAMARLLWYSPSGASRR